MIESELFGYKRGAFTGAASSGKTGLFIQAHQGVVFLDEISELPLNMQVKLLRVIQEKEVVPIGSVKPVPIDVQIIAATNRNLRKMVQEGLFREDLYYRLNVVNIHIPPLRERKEDIPPLIEHFLEFYNKSYHKDVKVMEDAINILGHYPWYGNVREIKNFVERIIVISDAEQVIDSSNLNSFITRSYDEDHNGISISKIVPLQEALDFVEEKLITMAIEKYHSISVAAKILGLTQPTMSRKYKKIKEREMLNGLKPANKEEILEFELNHHLQSITTVIASSINVAQVKALKEDISISNSAYSELQNYLTQIRINEGKMYWSYIWYVNEKNQVINLVCDERLNMLPGEEYTGPPEMMKAILEGNSGNVSVTPKYGDKFGQWKTCIAPIIDKSGNIVAILGADFSGEYADRRIRYLKKILN